MVLEFVGVHVQIEQIQPAHFLDSRQYTVNFMLLREWFLEDDSFPLFNERSEPGRFRRKETLKDLEASITYLEKQTTESL